MSPPTSQRTEHAESIASLARIEAQDVLWVAPLREYLEHHGCRVALNREVNEVPTYVIAAGDTAFVKAFFEDTKWVYSKKLAVVYEGDTNDLTLLRSLGIKQYVTDPTPLDEKRTREIFAFFFAGREMSKDVRKEPTTTQKVSVMSKKASREETLGIRKRIVTDQMRIAEELRHIYQKKRPSQQRMLRGRIGRVTLWVGVMALGILTPTLLYLLSIVASAGLLTLGGKTLTSGDTRWTNTLISYSGTYQRIARTMLSVTSPVFALVGQGGFIEDQDRLLSILSQVASAESGVLTIFRSSRKVAGGILFPEDASGKAGVSDVIALSTDVSRVSEHLGLVAAQVDSLLLTRRFPFHTRIVSTFTSQALGKLNKLREIINYADKLLTLYPRSAGFRRKQTYLVLLQNSMELRPTGGFIGSLLVVSFVDGKVESLEVQDVYTADGQLKGHVEPPRPIREILGNEHWYLRDSNWNPDFAASGAQAAWFYEKELGQHIDGVIALSLPMVTKLLTMTGPIELLDFNERISESNFFAKSLLYTETDFFPGSTQKKDFLGALSSALLMRITTDPSLPAGALLALVSEAIEARDIQFYFTDSELQALVTQWGWQGGVSVRSCQGRLQDMPCIGDGIALVDANLGVNKANFFVTREAVSETTILENGDVEHTLTLSIHNSAPSQARGGGGYLSYMRFILPSDAEFLALTLDGVALPLREESSTVPPPAPYVVREQLPTLIAIHVPFTVNTRQTRQLTLGWVRRRIASFDRQATYQFTIRKQAGVAALPWRSAIQYPQNWAVAREDGVAKAGFLEYNTNLTKDATFRMIFQKTL